MSDTTHNKQNFWILVIIILLPIFILELRMYQQLKEQNMRIRWQNMRILNALSILPDKIVNIGEAKFYVPNYPMDIIQSEIVDKGNFYEIDFLKELTPYIRKDAVILDVGANIGNHSVYWALKADAKRIYVFEPVRDFFEILKTNVKLNNLTDKIIMFNIGLSNQKINGRISVFDRMNIGGTWVEQDANGNIILDKLDNIKIEENFIDLIKIDVEGHELRVLQGAKETLQKYKPAIFIEILEHSDNQKEIHEYLTNMG